MDIISKNTKTIEDREEGEIVDDEDGFEDISDSSISNLESSNTGKLPSNKDRLRALSLSSVSDVEITSVIPAHPKSKHPRRRKRSKSEKRKSFLGWRKSSQVLSDSEGEAIVNKKIKKQLKDAVRIKTFDKVEVHHNSLRTRLKEMVKFDSYTNTNKECTDTLAIQSLDSNAENTKEEQLSKDDNDSELRELRLEALKTAIMNKHKDRKKRKAQEDNILSDSSQKSDFSENIAVRSNDDADHPLKKPRQGNIVPEIKNGTSVKDEEDTDALRALLIASMNKNIKDKESNKVDKAIIKNKVIEIQSVEKSTNPSTVKVEIKNRGPLNNTKVNTVNNKKLPEINSRNNKYKIVNNTKLISESRKVTENSRSRTATLVSHKNKVINNTPALPVKNSVNHVHKQQNRFTHYKTVTVPPIKPIIIKVNDSEDSDDDIFDCTVKEQQTSTKNNEQTAKNALAKKNFNINTIKSEKAIESSIEMFLKEERAKVEAQLQLATKLENCKKNTAGLLKPIAEIETNCVSEMNKENSDMPGRVSTGKAGTVASEVNSELSAKMCNGKLKVKACNSVAVNSKSDIKVSVSKNINVANKLPKNQPPPGNLHALAKDKLEAASTKTVPPVSSNLSRNPGEKSAVKLLPEDQQEEYRSLIKRMQQKKSRTRKISQHTAATTISSNKLIKNKVTNIKSPPTTCKVVSALNKGPVIDSNQKLAKKTLIQNAQRLQIESKLRPIKEKIEAVKKERVSLELTASRILREYKMVKEQIEKCKEKQELLTKQYQERKKQIDSSSLRQESAPKVQLTSTPKDKNNVAANLKPPLNISPIPSAANQSTVRDDKVKIQINSLIEISIEDTTKHQVTTEMEKIDAVKKLEVDVKTNGRVTAVPDDKVVDDSNSIPESDRAVPVTDKKNENDNQHATEVKKTKLLGMAVQEALINKAEGARIQDAEARLQDAEAKLPTEVLVENTVQHYISPLGNFSRCEEVDPMAIFCPYQVNGSCRDAECKYAHF